MPIDSDSSTAVALGDVDGDGDLDMVFGNIGYCGLSYCGAEQNRIYLNNGTGTYTDATAVRMPVRIDITYAVALDDVDGDGDLDMVFGNIGQNRLYLNLLRQLDAPFPLRIGQTYTLAAYARYGPKSEIDVALLFLSGATAQVPLPPFGTIGLDPTQLLTVPPFPIPQPAGVGSVSFTVPNVEIFVGTFVYAQALLVPLAFPAQARLTNVTADEIVQ